jgi:ornithine decarboxylase
MDGTPSPRLLAAAELAHSPAALIDLAVVQAKYEALRAALPAAHVLYAVKANPHPGLVKLLAGLGCGFDVASPGELKRCLMAGAAPEMLSYGNTIKKEHAIAEAHQAGVARFAVDCPMELEKVGRAAPGARVFARLGVSGTGAEWPLTHKFGCTIDEAVELLEEARRIGLRPEGVSFHVGSQQMVPDAWRLAIHRASEVFRHAAKRGIALDFLNLGGGWPAHYMTPPPPLETYAGAVDAALRQHFGAALPRLYVEPGRYMVADAGIVVSEVVLVAQRPHERVPRWVYVDAGIYAGLEETTGERIRYRLLVPGPARPMGPVVLSGPTCDSADVLYRHHVELPLDLQAGERVIFLSAGAYSATCSSVDFNGFPALSMQCV